MLVGAALQLFACADRIAYLVAYLSAPPLPLPESGPFWPHAIAHTMDWLVSALLLLTKQQLLGGAKSAALPLLMPLTAAKATRGILLEARKLPPNANVAVAVVRGSIGRSMSCQVMSWRRASSGAAVVVTGDVIIELSGECPVCFQPRDGHLCAREDYNESPLN